MSFRLVGILILISVSWTHGQIMRKAVKKKNTHLNAIKADRMRFGNKEYTAVGISLNAINYYGDLAPLPKRISTDIRFTRPGIGLSYSIRKGPRFTMQSQFIYGTITGSDATSALKDNTNGIFRLRRNAAFKNSIKELSLSAVFDLFDNSGFYTHRPQWTPYAFIGASIFHHNPKGKIPEKDLNGNPFAHAGQWVALRPLGTEGQYAHLDPGDANYGIKPYSLIQPSLLFGFGVRYRLTEVLDLWFDFSYRYTATDYLDDVSRNYVDLGVLPDALAKSMSYRTYDSGVSSNYVITYQGRDGKQYNVEAGYGSEYPSNIRGNKKDRDVLLLTSVRVTHIIGNTFHKPKSR